MTRLSEEQERFLGRHDWGRWVGDRVGVWVSVDEQVMRIVHGKDIVWQTRCSTAKKGTGSRMNSFKTPLGWHSVVAKTGADAPKGQVFRGGKPTSKIWKPGNTTRADLVLTRILFLTGEEPGKNKGGKVDSFARHIYIHGTNDEARIGRPVSQGCVRLTNDDVIRAYELIAEGTRVLITEEEARSEPD
ncbi:MAG: L,D-transpeptidase [Candidatus Hydrogenedentes bacterium]|nr:L,D-transpeptidase [Candidatus Hydrogenedentota bacterium]